MDDYDLAWLSNAIYSKRIVFESAVHNHGFILTHFFDHNDTQAALVAAKTGSALVFRGTEASSWRIRDIWSNVTWPAPTVWQGKGKAHSGYSHHLSFIGHSALEMAEDTASATPLYVTGHSLGGSIGTLFASWYFYEHPTYRLRSLVTFGAPKALNEEASEMIYCPVSRYAVRGDFAPHWPPVPGLVHPAPAIRLPPLKKYHGVFKRHDAKGYVELINRFRTGR